MLSIKPDLHLSMTTLVLLNSDGLHIAFGVQTTSNHGDADPPATLGLLALSNLLSRLSALLSASTAVSPA